MLHEKKTKTMQQIKPITEEEWLGLTLAEAMQKAQYLGYTHRIIEEDGKSHIVSADVKSNRVNFRLRNNLIIGVITG